MDNMDNMDKQPVSEHEKEHEAPFFDLNEPFDESDDDDHHQQQQPSSYRHHEHEFENGQANHSAQITAMNYTAPTSEANHEEGEMKKRSRCRMDHTGDSSSSSSSSSSIIADANEERRKRSRPCSQSPSLSSSSKEMHYSTSQPHTLMHNNNNSSSSSSSIHNSYNGRADHPIHDSSELEAIFARARHHEQRERQKAVQRHNSGVDYIFKKVLEALESRRYRFSLAQKAEALEKARNHVNREMWNDDKVRDYCSHMVTLMKKGNVEEAISLARELDVEGHIIPPSAFKCLLLGMSFHRKIEMGQVWFDKLIHGHKHKPTQGIMEVFLFGFMRVGNFEEAKRRMISLNKEFGFFPTLITVHNYIRCYLEQQKFDEALDMYHRIKLIPSKDNGGIPLEQVLSNTVPLDASLKPNMETFKLLIRGYLAHRRVKEALHVFQLIEEAGMEPKRSLFEFFHHTLENDTGNLENARLIMDWYERCYEMYPQEFKPASLEDIYVLQASRLQNWAISVMENHKFTDESLAVENLDSDFNTLLICFSATFYLGRKEKARSIVRFIVLNGRRFLAHVSNYVRLVRTLRSCQEHELVQTLLYRADLLQSGRARQNAFLSGLYREYGMHEIAPEFAITQAPGRLKL